MGWKTDRQEEGNSKEEKGPWGRLARAVRDEPERKRRRKERERGSEDRDGEAVPHCRDHFFLAFLHADSGRGRRGQLRATGPRRAGWFEASQAPLKTPVSVRHRLARWARLASDSPRPEPKHFGIPALATVVLICRPMAGNIYWLCRTEACLACIVVSSHTC
jgi:hypothetical protein